MVHEPKGIIEVVRLSLLTAAVNIAQHFVFGVVEVEHWEL